MRSARHILKDLGRDRLTAELLQPNELASGMLLQVGTRSMGCGGWGVRWIRITGEGWGIRVVSVVRAGPGMTRCRTFLVAAFVWLITR